MNITFPRTFPGVLKSSKASAHFSSGNFAKMKLFVCPKDYIRYRMTGTLGIDMSDASGTGFFDTRNRRWSDELIAIAGLDKAIFPVARESIELAGTVTKEAADEARKAMTAAASSAVPIL